MTDWVLLMVIVFLIARDVWRDIHAVKLEKDLRDRISAGNYTEYAGHRAAEQYRQVKAASIMSDEDLIAEANNRGLIHQGLPVT